MLQGYSVKTFKATQDKVTRALPVSSQAEAGKVNTLPQNGLQEKLAAIWQEVLGKPDIGIHDNFFELGGHSLSAVSITAKMRTAFSVALPLKTLLDNPTIAQLSVQLEGFRSGSSPQQVPVPPPIRRASNRKPIM